MPRTEPIQKQSQSRVYVIEDGAGPSHTPVYYGLSRALSPDWPQGDITPQYAPSEDAYGQFDVIDEIIGQPGLPTLSIETEKKRVLSEMLRLVRKGCISDLHIHIGACKNPTDFNQGWELITVLEHARPTNYGSGDLGSLDGSDAPVLETVPFTGRNLYEIVPLKPAEIAGSQIVQEVVDVAICDSQSCGECGIPSDGCQKVFALTMSAGGSPGLPAEVIYSEDGGATIGETNITSLAANEDPDAMACVGENLVVVSNESGSLHYAPIADILDEDETWTEVTTGFNGSGPPNDIFSLGRTFTWIVGDGGYIYFSDDITAGVEEQTSGTITAQNLNAIHGVDKLNLVAVGDSNAVLVTSNGGSTWSSVTGPAVGVNLNAIFMKSTLTWFIGDAGGQLWYTLDGGESWTEKTFPGSGAGVVRDITFATENVGYMAHDTATPRGRILRTIDGGHSWYVLPETTTSTMPANDQINAIAACEEDPNLVYGGGLADNATDGFLVKVA